MVFVLVVLTMMITMAMATAVTIMIAVTAKRTVMIVDRRHECIEGFRFTEERQSFSTE